MRSVLLGKYSQRARWALHGLGHVLKMEWGEKKHQILVGGISDDLKKVYFACLVMIKIPCLLQVLKKGFVIVYNCE